MSASARTFVLGHLGSGKTEVAIHFALSLTTEAKRPLLLDLDFITPYYRCRDVAGELAGQGVDVVAPEGGLARSDLPVITGRASQAVLAYDGPVIADVGGDEGARVVGGMAGRLPAGTYRAWMVVNPYRPGTRTPEQTAAYARWLEQVSRIRLTGLINNANLGLLTTAEHVEAGLNHVQTAASMLRLPVCFSAARAEIAGLLPGKVMPLRLRMRPPWEQKGEM